MSASAFIFVLLLQGPIHHGSTIPTGAAAAEDWSASFVAWWAFEESAGSAALANDSTSCGTAGTDCDLTDSGTVGRDTTNYQEGSQSATFASSDYFSCQDSTCDELDAIGSGESLTFGCWWRSGNDSTQQIIDNWDGSGGGRGGYKADRDSNNDRATCYVRDTNSEYNILTQNNSMPADDSWIHYVCQMTDDGTGSFRTYINGEENSNLTTTTPEIGADGEDFFLGSQNGSTPFMLGELDECFVIFDYLTAAEVCRVCSCQIDGSLCTCDGTSYNDAGRNSSDCGSCTLPDCNAAAP
jgi:hypothetical protein